MDVGPVQVLVDHPIPVEEDRRAPPEGELALTGPKDSACRAGAQRDPRDTAAGRRLCPCGGGVDSSPLPRPLVPCSLVCHNLRAITTPVKEHTVMRQAEAQERSGSRAGGTF